MPKPEFNLTVRVYGVDTLLETNEEVKKRANAPFRLTDSGKLLAKDFQTHVAQTFRKRGRPKWAPLTDNPPGYGYASYKRRVRPGRSLLVFDGDLKKSLTGNNKSKGWLYNARSRRLVMGSRVPYAEYHQDGTSRMVARPLFILTKGVAERWADIVRDEIFRDI